MRRKANERGWKRHLDGWQAGLVVVVIAGSAIILGIPRAVAPMEIPQPKVDRLALRQTMLEDDRLAIEAVAKRLDVDIRTAGKAFREYNRVVAKSDHFNLSNARTKVITTAQKALKRSPEELKILRAYQLQRFMQEIARWQETGDPSEELIDLSGDFVDTVKRNRWCRGDDRELVADERVLRVIYKKRWNDIMGMASEPFTLTLDEDRVRHGFLIRFPFTTKREVFRGQHQGPAAQATAAKRRMGSVQRLGKRDPDYPTHLATGVIFFQQQQFAAAVKAFRSHLTAHPDGPYTLRTHNYLKAALDQSFQGPGL